MNSPSHEDKLAAHTNQLIIVESNFRRVFTPVYTYSQMDEGRSRARRVVDEVENEEEC